MWSTDCPRFWFLDWHCFQGPQQIHESRGAEAQLRPHCLTRKIFGCWIRCCSRHCRIRCCPSDHHGHCQERSHCAICRHNCQPPAVAETMSILHASTHFYSLFRKVIHCKPTPPNNVYPCWWKGCPMLQTSKNHPLFPLAAKPVLEGLVHTDVNRLTQQCASTVDMLNLITQILDFGHDRCRHMASV